MSTASSQFLIRLVTPADVSILFKLITLKQSMKISLIL